MCPTHEHVIQCILGFYWVLLLFYASCHAASQV
jgi:hypothetical protein